VNELLHELKAAYPERKLTRVPALSFYLVRDEWVDLNFHGLGFYLNDPSFQVRAIEQEPFYLEAALMSRNWYTDSILNADSKIDNEDSSDQWRSGNMIFTLTSHEWAYAADPGFVDPSFRQQMSLLYPDKRTVNRSPLANVAAINRNSEHPDLVLRFLEMLNTDRKLFDLVIYGIQGQTYEMDGDTLVYPSNLNYSTSNYVGWGGQWAFWNPEFLRPTETYPGDFWQEEDRFARLPQNVDSPLEGLLIHDRAISKLVENRDQLYEDEGKAIEYGMVADVQHAVQAYRQRQLDHGLNAIIAEVQRQVDLYRSTHMESVRGEE
jgi:putative aldouronate transport system substrate-binding protein